MARMVRAGTLQPQHSHSLNQFDIKPAHAMGGGSAATRGHRTPEPANTELRAQVVKVGMQANPLTILFISAGRGAIPTELTMNAIAEREVRAYDLAERRRAYIAEQIRNCLYGKTLYVNIAWTLQSIPQKVSRIGLIEEIENALLASSSAGFDYSAKLLAALDDESLRPALRADRERIIGDWADTTHNCMTQQELEALPC